MNLILIENGSLTEFKLKLADLTGYVFDDFIMKGGPVDSTGRYLGQEGYSLGKYVLLVVGDEYVYRLYEWTR